MILDDFVGNYKTRGRKSLPAFAAGSRGVGAGNPIYTNFLWNEIGRGNDLHQLESWITQNPNVIRDLTTAVFASEAPRWSDFFNVANLSESRARNGQVLFNQHCSVCHGHYEKAWDLPGAPKLAGVERIQTTQVIYPRRTRVEDVGTDLGRYQGMQSLLALNDLALSKNHGVKIEENGQELMSPSEKMDLIEYLKTL